MGRAQAARRKNPTPSKPQIGSVRDDGKIYAGGDYGYQHPQTFKKLEQQGELALGAGAARRVNNLLQKADQLRDRIFGTDENLRQNVQKVEQFIGNNTVIGVAGQGENVLAKKISKQFNVSPAIGALVIGQLVPGPNAPTKRTGKPNTPNVGSELPRIRQQMARQDQLRIKDPNVGIEIEPSRAPDGRRIQFENASLNVRQDPATGRLRGADTASPRNTVKQSLREGDPSVERSASGNGYRIDGKKAGRVGDSGNAAASAPKSLRRELEQQFDALHPNRPKRAVRAGQRRSSGTKAQQENRAKRKADWVNRQLNNAISEHTAGNAQRRTQTGQTPSSNVEPGARYRGDVANLSEAQKQSGTPNPLTIRASVPKQAPKKPKPGEVTQGSTRTSRALAIQKQRRQEQSKGQPPNRGQSVDANGKPLSKQVQEDMKGEARSSIKRQAAQMARDPQLSRDMKDRVRALKDAARKVTKQGKDPADVDGVFTRGQLRELGIPKAAEKDLPRLTSRTGEIYFVIPEPRQRSRIQRLNSATPKPSKDQKAPGVGNAPQGFEGRNQRNYAPPARTANQSSERYQQRARQARRSGGFANEAQVQQALEQGRDPAAFKRSGELKGIDQKGKVNTKGRSSGQSKAAEKLMDRKARAKKRSR